MCFGSPKPPKIVYQGPSAEDVAAGQRSLDLYKQQMEQQQGAFQQQLQQQIDAANQQTAKLQDQYSTDAAAAAAAAAAQQAGAYAVTASQTAPVNAQTTAAVTKKEKERANLKISLGGTAATAGTGLNIGV